MSQTQRQSRVTSAVPSEAEGNGTERTHSWAGFTSGGRHKERTALTPRRKAAKMTEMPIFLAS